MGGSLAGHRVAGAVRCAIDVHLTFQLAGEELAKVSPQMHAGIGAGQMAAAWARPSIHWAMDVRGRGSHWL